MSTYKWAHTVCVFLGLGYLTQDDILKFHLFACKIHDVFVFNSWVVLCWVDVPHFLYPYSNLSICFVEGHLGCFQFLGAMNKVAMNIVEHVSLWYGRASFEYMPRNGISWSRTIPSFLKNHQTDFQSVYTSLHYHEQWRSVPLSPHPRQHVLSTWVLDFSYSDRNKMESYFAFPWWLRTLNISLSASQTFEIPLLRILCLALYPIFNRVTWFFIYFGY